MQLSYYILINYFMDKDLHLCVLGSSMYNGYTQD